MKTIIILILSFLLFSYSISAEEKNGAITETVKNSEIKILEERIKGSEKQINILKDELASKSEQNNEWFIVGAAAGGTLLGAALGAYLSYFFTNKSERQRRKEEQIEKQKTLTDNIITDCLKYYLKVEEKIVRVFGLKLELLDLKNKKHATASESQIKFSQTLSEEFGKNFLAELKFYSHQLMRLKNLEINNDIDSILESVNALMRGFLESENLDEVVKAYDKYIDLQGKFVVKCTNITKV